MAIPPLIERLGPERFSVLTLAWVLVGYFVVFDFGLGRAVTKLVAERIGTDREYESPALIWTALALMVVVGLVGAFLLALGASFWVGEHTTIPQSLRAETTWSLYMLAVSVPFLTGVAGLRGALEAYRRFDVTNAIRGPFGILNYLGPLVVSSYSENLVSVLSVVVVVRITSFFVHLVACVRTVPGLGWRVRFDARQVRTLISFGGWMTVSNIATPILLTVDRFIIGSLVAIGMVAFYTVPYEVVTKLWVLPASILSVLFPVFSAIQERDQARTSKLYQRASLYIFVLMFPVVLTLVAFAYEGLDLWLGPAFASSSCVILQILAVGILVNAMAYVPYGLIQGAGRPDLIAKLLIVEFPGYVVLVWLLTIRYGLVGTAVAWLCRVVVDTVMFHVLARRFLNRSLWDASGMGVIVAVFVTALLLLIGSPPESKPWLMVGLVAGYLYIVVRSDVAVEFAMKLRHVIGPNRDA